MKKLYEVIEEKDFLDALMEQDDLGFTVIEDAFENGRPKICKFILGTERL